MTSFQPTVASRPPPNVIYRQRVPSELPVNWTPLNPLNFLLRAALIYPREVALVHQDVEYTFEVWAQRVQNLAYALLHESGIRAGDRVAVLAPNTPMIADAHHGILAARGVIVCINTRLTQEQVEYILEHSGSKLVLVDHQYAHLVERAKIPILVCQDTGRPGDPYEEFLTRGRAASHERGWQGLEMELDESANATLNYTSGTTGRPKGVMCTLRGSYLAAISNAYESKLNRHSTYLWVLPMFHASGWTFPWALTFSFAKQITLRTVDPDAIWEHFLYSNVTHYSGAPTVQLSIINSPLARRLSRPIIAVIAGAAPTASLLAELENKGFQVCHVYGLTETYGPFTRNYDRKEYETLPQGERARLHARQGHAFANADEVRVVLHDHSGAIVDVPDDGQTIGEVVCRGNITMKEYYNDREATEKAVRNGYFYTGDLAVRNEDRSITIKDRAKDLVISGGENASSLAIEQELAGHPDVFEVAVVARPHETWGERAMAFVVLRAEAVKKWWERHHEFADDLKQFAKGRLPGFARPEWVTVVDELPKTSTGKIQKNVLRSTARAKL